MNVAAARSGSGRRIAIIGAGPGGLCAAIELRRAGFDDVVILERSHGVGGTWYHNRYPGAAVDIQSHLYCFSFEPKPDWTRPYATQPELVAYFEHCAAKYGLGPQLRFGSAVRSARWDEAHALWRLGLEGGEELVADVVVSALGMFNELHWPEIPGRERFRGHSFHSARWDHDHDLAGRDVAVIGSAASAVQFVPEIAPRVRRLFLFQRTANWILPKEDEPFTAEQIAGFRREPALSARLRQQIFDGVEPLLTFGVPELLRRSEEACLRNLAQVRDPELRRKLTPTHPWGCKRPLITNDFYPAMNRENVELVTEAIERISETGVVTRDGREHRADTIVYATGFETTRFLSALEVEGRGGRRLTDAWSDGAQAYLGITTSGFPNLFMLYGPNTNNGSILFMLESQVAYVVRQLERMQAEDLAWIDVRPEAMARYNDAIQREIASVAVWQAACNGYYRSPSGRVVTQWPHTMAEFRRRTQQPDAEAYEARATVGYARMDAAGGVA